MLIVLPGSRQALGRDDLGWVPGSEWPSDTRTLWLWKEGATWLRRNPGYQQRLPPLHLNFSSTLLPTGSHARGSLSSSHLRHIQEAPRAQMHPKNPRDPQIPGPPIWRPTTCPSSWGQRSPAAQPWATMTVMEPAAQSLNTCLLITYCVPGPGLGSEVQLRRKCLLLQSCHPQGQQQTGWDVRPNVRT